MPDRLRLVVCLLVFVATLLPTPNVTAQSSSPQPQAPGPASSAQEVRAGLYDAQAALLTGDRSAAIAAFDRAVAGAAPLLSDLEDNPDVAKAIEAELASASAAITAADAAELARVHGAIWALLVRTAYGRSISATERGDAAGAASWLLLRDFRVTTRFDRPDADATLAVRGLERRTTTPAAAAAAIRADLLDTYQAKLEASLTALESADPANLLSSEAEALGFAVGSWPLFAPALEEQAGSQARTEADATFSSLAQATRDGNMAAFSAARQRAVDTMQSFRAAPLSEPDQVRRAGQLMRYLALVPMEYGRGVKDGQILLPLEIQEAQAFLDGAQSAFADLRLPLRTMDVEKTATLAAALDQLALDLHAASTREAIADPAAIEASAASAASALVDIVPPSWLEASGDSDFDIVSTMLDQVIAAVSAGQYQQAESARIEAYAIFETGPEKRLLAFTPSEAQRVERLFWEGDGQTPGLHRLLSSQANVGEVRATRSTLDAALSSAQAALNAGTAPAAVVFNAATIVFREGLEAVLIMASLLASMIGANRQYKRPLAFGAVAALAATAALFVLARTALLSFGRYSEQIEAIVSVIAIAVLLLVMNWFFHKVYWTRWIARHHEHRRRLLIGGAGPALGIVLLGFSSVFREGAETVLFLQALVLDAGTAIVLQGTLLGLAATAIVGVLTLMLQTKLPHKKMLIVTGVMIAVVLVTMVGSTVHTLQLVGWAPISPIPGSENLPYWLGVWFGVFGTWQGVTAQIVAFAFVVGSYFVAERQFKRARLERIQAGQTPGAHQHHAAPAS